MPYALFCHEMQLSKAYPTEADIWERARRSGLLVDVASADNGATPRALFENDYEIRPCPPDSQEDFAADQVGPEWRVETDLMPLLTGWGGGQVVSANTSAPSPRSAAPWKSAVAMRVLSGVKSGWIHGRHRGRI